MAQGAPTKMIDRHGRVLSLIRDPQRNLHEIRTPNGHWIKLAYDDQSRVTRAESDTGDWVEYLYGSNALLTDVTYSDGRVRHYTYAGNLLTWVRDEAGRALIHNWYRDWKVVRQDYSDGTRYDIKYTMAENNAYANEATVMLSDGSTRSFRTADAVPQLVKDWTPATMAKEVTKEIWTQYRAIVWLLYVAIAAFLISGSLRVRRILVAMICATVFSWNMAIGIPFTLTIIAAGVKRRRRIGAATAETSMASQR
jgi:YD repeat-containing protein